MRKKFTYTILFLIFILAIGHIIVINSTRTDIYIQSVSHDGSRVLYNLDKFYWVPTHYLTGKRRNNQSLTTHINLYNIDTDEITELSRVIEDSHLDVRTVMYMNMSGDGSSVFFTARMNQDDSDRERNTSQNIYVYNIYTEEISPLGHNRMLDEDVFFEAVSYDGSLVLFSQYQNVDNRQMRVAYIFDRSNDEMIRMPHETTYMSFLDMSADGSTFLYKYDDTQMYRYTYPDFSESIIEFKDYVNTDMRVRRAQISFDGAHTSVLVGNKLYKDTYNGERITIPFNDNNHTEGTVLFHANSDATVYAMTRFIDNDNTGVRESDIIIYRTEDMSRITVLPYDPDAFHLTTHISGDGSRIFYYHDTSSHLRPLAYRGYVYDIQTNRFIALPMSFK